MGKEKGKVGNWSLNICGNNWKTSKRKKGLIVKHTELKKKEPKQQKEFHTYATNSPTPNELE